MWAGHKAEVRRGSAWIASLLKLKTDSEMWKRRSLLRAAVNERLAAAAEEIFALVERTIAEYEEEVYRCKAENQRRQQLGSGVGIHWFSPDPRLMQTVPETPQIKEEPSELCLDPEEEPLPEVSAVCVKTEEEREQRDNTDTDNDEDWEHPAGCSTVQMQTEADGGHVHTLDTNIAAHNSHLFRPGDLSGTRPQDRGAERKSECSVCRKRFKTKQDLTRHLRLHTGERPYVCSVCEKSFSQMHSLKSHMRSHTGDKTHSCPVCNKTFTQKATLDQHLRVHTGERPYGCSVCMKTFNRKTILDRHMRVHTGERPYSCSVCTKSFSQKWNLFIHERLHEEKKHAAI